MSFLIKVYVSVVGGKVGQRGEMKAVGGRILDLWCLIMLTF